MMSEIRRTSEAQAEAYFLSHEIADFNNNVERALLERKKRGGSKYQFISPRKTVRLGDLDVIAFTKVRRTFWRDGYSYVVILDDLTIEIASESELKKLIDDFDLIGEPGLPSEQLLGRGITNCGVYQSLYVTPGVIVGVDRILPETQFYLSTAFVWLIN